MPAIGTAPLMKPGLVAASQAAITLSAIRKTGREGTSPGIHCADKSVAAEQLRHDPPSVLVGGARQRQWLRGTLENDSMWVPHEGCHTGTPSLTTAGFLPCFSAFDATLHNFLPRRMTIGQMTCASG